MSMASSPDAQKSVHVRQPSGLSIISPLAPRRENMLPLPPLNQPLREDASPTRGAARRKLWEAGFWDTVDHIEKLADAAPGARNEALAELWNVILREHTKKMSEVRGKLAVAEQQHKREKERHHQQVRSFADTARELADTARELAVVLKDEQSSAANNAVAWDESKDACPASTGPDGAPREDAMADGNGSGQTAPHVIFSGKKSVAVSTHSLRHESLAEDANSLWEYRMAEASPEHQLQLIRASTM
jgi:hypothetical protein